MNTYKIEKGGCNSIAEEVFVIFKKRHIGYYHSAEQVNKSPVQLKTSVTTSKVINGGVSTSN